MFFNPDNGWIPTQISMRLAKTQSNSETDLGVIIPLIVNGQNLWITTKTSSDLAVVALPKEINKYKNIHGVALRDFGTADDIYQGAAVYVLGYPGILGETYQTATVARGGIIAWTDPDNLEGKPFLVDANIFSGSSGWSWFHVRSGFDKHGRMDLGGGLVFIGIVSQDAQEYEDVVATDLINPALNRQLTQPNADPSKKPDRVITICKEYRRYRSSRASGAGQRACSGLLWFAALHSIAGSAYSLAINSRYGIIGVADISSPMSL